ncbi:Rap1a/Tai family immunity protein [Roseibium sp.]|uniref:Rap1a/Tai family immunity protein n=1 Tax=Roseibium sp. TaxID=1936156 RepID=UPI003BB10CAB
MRIPACLFVFSFLAVLGCSPSWATSLDGKELHKYCSAQESPGAKAACIYYILGVAEGLHLGFMEGAKSLDSRITETTVRRSFCVSEDVSWSQLVSSVIDYLSQHPEHWDTEAVFVVEAALISGFPCD